MLKHVAIYPASHYIVPAEKMQQAVQEIEDEMLERVKFFKERWKAAGSPAYSRAHRL